MEQRVSLITLGVDDLAAARRFYEALGWRCKEVEETVFVQAGGSAIVLWGREKLAADAGIEDARSRWPTASAASRWPRTCARGPRSTR